VAVVVCGGGGVSSCSAGVDSCAMSLTQVWSAQLCLSSLLTGRSVVGTMFGMNATFSATANRLFAKHVSTTTSVVPKIQPSLPF
jgi:hypothetical protein